MRFELHEIRQNIHVSSFASYLTSPHHLEADLKMKTRFRATFERQSETKIVANKINKHSNFATVIRIYVNDRRLFICYNLRFRFQALESS